MTTAAIRDAMKKMTGLTDWAEGRWRRDKEIEDLEASSTPRIRRATNYKGSGLATYALANTQKHEVLISELYKNVKSFPQGGDRGILTQVVEMVKQNPGLDRNLSRIHEIIDHFNLLSTNYGILEDIARRRYWAAQAEKLCVRAYDTTNRFRLKNGTTKTAIRKVSSTRKSEDPLRQAAGAGVTKKRNTRRTI
jgi:hypothetical protein